MKAKFFIATLSLFIGNSIVYSALPKNTSPQPPIVVHKIDLNTADAAQLTGSIKGIGKKRAEAIVAYRKSHHGFKSLLELAEVKGMGQHFVDINKDKLSEVFTISKVE